MPTSEAWPSHVVAITDPRWRLRTSLGESESLSIEQKIKILEKLDRSISNTAIAFDFNTGKSTVTDIQKSEATPVTVMDTCQNHPTVPFSCFSRNCPYLNKTVSIQGRRCMPHYLCGALCIFCTSLYQNLGAIHPIPTTVNR